jgi:predicted TIM-barrel fold metal-dependent hydrolase
LIPEKSLLNRRELFATVVTVSATSALIAEAAQSDEHEPEGISTNPSLSPYSIIDTNIHLFQWPFRRLPLDETAALVTKLRSLGVTQAWAGSFEGLLHRDVAGVNQRLAEACQQHPELVPLGSVNLELPDWQEDLRRCVETHNMPGIRLHPGYHGYSLADPRFTLLLKQATVAGRFVQIVAAMEDTRTQHPMLRIEEVDLTPLPSLMDEMPDARVQILGVRPRSPLLDLLVKSPGVFFDTSRVDGSDSLALLMDSVPVDRVIFGTGAPFLIPEASLIRVYESELKIEMLRPLLSESANQLLKRSNT